MEGIRDGQVGDYIRIGRERGIKVEAKSQQGEEVKKGDV